MSCVCPRTGTQRQMRYGGFEKERSTLKYRCPAEHHGYECAGRDCCSVGKALRIDIAQERRVLPLPRHSLKWERLFDMRTAVERVNSRLDVSFGFEHRAMRGLKKMQTHSALRCYGEIKEKLRGSSVPRQLVFPLLAAHVCHCSPETDAGQYRPACRIA